MYSDTVTVFNRYESSLGDTWYPTVIAGVDLNIDKAAILAKYGAESQDKAVLHIKYTKTDGGIYVAGKKWLSPKEWDRQTNDLLPKTITFTSEGEDSDFFMWGKYDTAPVPDADFDKYDGFYNYMLKKHDYVFTVSSAALYTVIPHFEILGR